MLPTSGLLTSVLTPGVRAVEITVQFTTASGVFTPGSDVGDFSMTLWRQSVSDDGVTSYVQSETTSGLRGYVAQVFDSMAHAGVCGVSIHSITPPVDVAVTGFRVIARSVQL